MGRTADIPGKSMLPCRAGRDQLPATSLVVWLPVSLGINVWHRTMPLPPSSCGVADRRTSRWGMRA